MSKIRKDDKKQHLEIIYWNNLPYQEISFRSFNVGVLR